MIEDPAVSLGQPARIDPIRAGLLCRCPDCGRGPLFAGFLKVVETCEVCGHDFRRLNTGDGAAVFVMQAAGAPVVFTALVVQIVWNPPVWAVAAAALPLVAGLSFALMRPAKGLMIALQMREATRRG